MLQTHSADDSIFDIHGYRLNVGILLVNKKNQVFFARRAGGYDAWQLPQGGMRAGEDSLATALRELFEETGISSDRVEVLGVSKSYRSYRLPSRYRRRHRKMEVQCLGQKQRWYLMRYIHPDDADISVRAVPHPEFDAWQWVDYWFPLQKVVHFKYEVYRSVLQEFAPLLQIKTPPPAPLPLRQKQKKLS